MDGWMTPEKFKFRSKIEKKERERTFLAGGSFEIYSKLENAVKMSVIHL